MIISNILVPAAPRRGCSDGLSTAGGAFVQHVDEPVEEVGGVVGAGGSLGVVLDGERGDVGALDPLVGVVVEVDVGDADARRVGQPVSAASGVIPAWSREFRG